MHKRGIELSINFLVTIIIALVIFAFGIKFIYDIASQATELEGLTTDDLDERIGQLLCESTDRVCIGIDRRTIETGKFDIFGLKIINVQESRNFHVEAIVAGRSVNNGPISPLDGDELLLKYRKDLFIERNQEESMGIGVEVPRGAESGTYIINVQVQHETANGFEDYSSLRKVYVEVP